MTQFWGLSPSFYFCPHPSTSVAFSLDSLAQHSRPLPSYPQYPLLPSTSPTFLANPDLYGIEQQKPQETFLSSPDFPRGLQLSTALSGPHFIAICKVRGLGGMEGFPAFSS